MSERYLLGWKVRISKIDGSVYWATETHITNNAAAARVWRTRSAALSRASDYDDLENPRLVRVFTRKPLTVEVTVSETQTSGAAWLANGSAALMFDAGFRAGDRVRVTRLRPKAGP